MAVAVNAVPHIVLDEAYRIVEVGPDAQAAFGPLLGQVLWECFPDSEPLFRPYYERARRTGQPVEFVQFYDGFVGRVRATPVGSRVALSWEYLVRLDTLTLDGLRLSLDEAIASIEEAETDNRRRRTRDSLRLVSDTDD